MITSADINKQVLIQYYDSDSGKYKWVNCGARIFAVYDLTVAVILSKHDLRVFKPNFLRVLEPRPR